MTRRSQTSTASEQAMAAEEQSRGFSSVSNIAVRVAGFVPNRVDLKFAGTPQQQMGLSLGTVLVFINSYLTARAIADRWAEAAPLARSLSQTLPPQRRSAMTSGPWLLSAMVRLSGTPTVHSEVLPAQPGRGLPTMLRIQVGPVTWELADGIAFTSMFNAWQVAADVLAYDRTGRE